jgi:hypothetical protein
MIEIVFDEYELYSSDDFDSLVTETSQYEEELLKIKSSVETGGSLRIIVRNRVTFNWFDAALKYGAQKKIINPVAMLMSEAQQAVAPLYLEKNPRWVVELGLLEKIQEQPVKNEAIENWLKRVLLGGVWVEKAPDSPERLSVLIAYFFEHQESDLHELEMHLLREHLQKWIRNNPHEADFFSWLQQSPFDRSKYLVWEQLLSLFPEDRVAAWLQQDNMWYELSQFPNRHQLPRFSLAVQLPETIATFARSFLVDQWKISPEGAITCITGELDFEKNFLLERLRQQLQEECAISQEMYGKLIKFNFPEVVSLARQLIPAKTPSPLAEESTVSEVQNWVANEYLPFYNSCSLLGQVDSTITHLTEFEKWLRQHYSKMLFKGEGMAYRQLAQIKTRILTDEPVLMVVFDGLDYLCASEELLPVMQDNGYFPLNDQTPFFSFLPTQTYIAKPTLVAGKMKEQIGDEEPTASYYKELLQDYLAISGDVIRSKTDKDGTLLELIQEPAKVYLYLDNHLDRELLHSNIRQYLRKKKYSEYIRKQAEEIAQCLKDYKEMYGKSLQVVICSDHGYTVIPKTATILTVATDKKSKIRTLVDYKSEDMVDLESEQIWKLSPDLYGLDSEMIMPCGYSCFNKRPYGATHGGCSPQEIAVPWFLLCEDKPASLVPLSLSLDGDIFRKRTQNMLELRIFNPNAYSITIVEIESKGLEISADLPVNIMKKTVSTLTASFDASNESNSFVEFSIRYHIKSMAGEMQNYQTLKVPTTGAMSTEFDDDFDI